MSILESLATILSVTVLDQTTKIAVERGVNLGGGPRLLGGLIKIKPVYNPGGAFGIFAHRGEIFTVFSLVVIGLLLTGIFFLDLKFLPVGLGLNLIAGGALGNLIDRFRNGAVTDFVQIGNLPVFNLADAMIVLGAGLVILSLITGEGHVER